MPSCAGQTGDSQCGVASIPEPMSEPLESGRRRRWPSAQGYPDNETAFWAATGRWTAQCGRVICCMGRCGVPSATGKCECATTVVSEVNAYVPLYSA